MATTEDDVRRLVAFDSARIVDIELFIADATLLATNVIGDALNTSTFDMVVRYLAAHLISISDPRVQMEKVKTLQVRYQAKIDLGLSLTHYGSTAMILDSSGRLAAWNDRVVNGGGIKQFFWAGSET